jgi:hypothetical protein
MQKPRTPERDPTAKQPPWSLPEVQTCTYAGTLHPKQPELHPKPQPPSPEPTLPRVTLLIQVKKLRRGAAARGRPSGLAPAPPATAPRRLTTQTLQRTLVRPTGA